MLNAFTTVCLIYETPHHVLIVGTYGSYVRHEVEYLNGWFLSSSLLQSAETFEVMIFQYQIVVVSSSVTNCDLKWAICVRFQFFYKFFFVYFLGDSSYQEVRNHPNYHHPPLIPPLGLQILTYTRRAIRIIFNYPRQQGKG